VSGLGRALDRLGSDLQAGQDLQLLAAAIERILLADQSMHPPHGGRGFRILDIQFGICGKLPDITMRAQVVWSQYGHCAHGDEDRLGA
jgi:hypothetical protein